MTDRSVNHPQAMGGWSRGQGLARQGGAALSLSQLAWFPCSSRTTAWHAMAFPAPMSPRPSVVLAFTLTRSTSTPRRRAMCARSLSRCGPILGSWATTVMSALPSGVAGPVDATQHLGEEVRAIRALPGRVRVGEEGADVPQAPTRRGARRRGRGGPRRHRSVPGAPSGEAGSARRGGRAGPRPAGASPTRVLCAPATSQDRLHEEEVLGVGHLDVPPRPLRPRRRSLRCA